MKNKNTNLLGFTLVELLVVIAIIGILTSVSVINVRSAIDKAEKTKVVTQMKDMQTMAMLCLDSNSELQCAGTQCNGTNTPGPPEYLCWNFLNSWRWASFDDYIYQKSKSTYQTGQFCYEIKKSDADEYIYCTESNCGEGIDVTCACAGSTKACSIDFDCCNNNCKVTGTCA